MHKALKHDITRHTHMKKKTNSQKLHNSQASGFFSKRKKETKKHECFSFFFSIHLLMTSANKL